MSGAESTTCRAYLWAQLRSLGNGLKSSLFKVLLVSCWKRASVSISVHGRFQFQWAFVSWASTTTSRRRARETENSAPIRKPKQNSFCASCRRNMKLFCFCGVLHETKFSCFGCSHLVLFMLKLMANLKQWFNGNSCSEFKLESVWIHKKLKCAKKWEKHMTLFLTGFCIFCCRSCSRRLLLSHAVLKGHERFFFHFPKLRNWITCSSLMAEKVKPWALQFIQEASAS